MFINSKMISVSMWQYIVGDAVYIDWGNIFVMLIVLVFMVAFFIIIIRASRRKSIAIKKIFESQAQKRNGSATGEYGKNELTFMHRDYFITVSSYPGNKYQSRYTRVVTKLQKPGLPSMNIYCETFGSEIGKKLGKLDIQIGRSEFDEKFMIKGSDEIFIRNFLTSKVQDIMLKLLNYTPYIALEDNELTVNVPIVLDTDEKYDLLIDSALAIIDRLNEI